ncbi:MAG: hypothetical protein SFV52_03135 [Saprospiraceae bacterium]|nr:hypothetical protein [Saprospiraceae bacterium]
MEHPLKSNGQFFSDGDGGLRILAAKAEAVGKAWCHLNLLSFAAGLLYEGVGS